MSGKENHHTDAEKESERNPSNKSAAPTLSFIDDSTNDIFKTDTGTVHNHVPCHAIFLGVPEE